MANWHQYFENTDLNDWSILGFHQAWIHEHREDPKKPMYQKANDYITKSLQLLINNCQDEEKAQKAILQNGASDKIKGKCNVGSELDVLCTPVEYQNCQKLEHAKLNCDQFDNVASYSCTLTKTVNSVSTRQEANKGPDPQPKGARTPPPRSLNEERLLSTPNK
nr:13193_t:CDS:2 [Entrophospora candida]